MRSAWIVLISFIVTTIVVGGGTYYFVNKKTTKDKNNLQAEIKSLQDRYDTAEAENKVISVQNVKFYATGISDEWSDNKADVIKGLNGLEVITDVSGKTFESVSYQGQIGTLKVINGVMPDAINLTVNDGTFTKTPISCAKIGEIGEVNSMPPNDPRQKGCCSGLVLTDPNPPSCTNGVCKMSEGQALICEPPK